MKNIVIISLFLMFSSGSFYFGQRIASDNVWTTCYAIDASRAASVLSAKYPDEITLQEYREKINRRHIGILYEGVIGLGRFKQAYTSKVPFLVGDATFAESQHSAWGIIEKSQKVGLFGYFKKNT